MQRMPRIRRGYVHVVNNDYFEWKMYAIGGSAGPTVNSEGNRFTASTDPSAKEVLRLHCMLNSLHFQVGDRLHLHRQIDCEVDYCFDCVNNGVCLLCNR